MFNLPLMLQRLMFKGMKGENAYYCKYEENKNSITGCRTNTGQY